MKQETLKHFGDGAIISAVSTGAVNKLGWLHYLNENAGGIGLMVTTFFGLIGMVFYYLTWKKSTQSDQNKKELTELDKKLDNHVKETKNGFELLNQGLAEISNKIDNGNDVF